MNLCSLCFLSCMLRICLGTAHIGLPWTQRHTSCDLSELPRANWKWWDGQTTQCAKYRVGQEKWSWTIFCRARAGIDIAFSWFPSVLAHRPVVHPNPTQPNQVVFDTDWAFLDGFPGAGRRSRWYDYIAGSQNQPKVINLTHKLNINDLTPAKDNL